MWKTGIAFVRGLNIFREKRISKKQMLNLLREIENKNLSIMGIYKTDNVIFKKRAMHFAQVGSEIEKILEEHFNQKVYVTVRSLRTIKAVLKQVEKYDLSKFKKLGNKSLIT